jgi:hypothetical protein
MNSIQDVETLKITFTDDSETSLPKWFTDQFEYFKNIIEDLGEDECTDNGTEYKRLELDMRGGMGSELANLLTKPILSFLKRFAYHINFLKEGDFDEDLDDDLDDDFDDPLRDKIDDSKDDSPKSDWNTPDGYQTKRIMNFIASGKWNELFQIYAVADYLGNPKICHAITDTIIKHLSDSNMIDIEKIQNKFNLKSQFTASQQKEILTKFDWRE